MKIYFLHNDDSDITMRVDISTPGIVTTQIQKKRSGGSTEVVDNSTDATGRIKIDPNDKNNLLPLIVGKSKDIKNSVITTVMIINLEFVDKLTWQAIFDNLTVKISMSGGPDNEQVFTNDSSDTKSKDATGQIIVLQTAIRLALLV